jgi:hypothetical protein
MKSPFKWDNHSDQPYILKDKAYKKAMRKKNAKDYLPLVLSNAILFPLGAFLSSLLKGKKQQSSSFFGMSVNLDKGDEQQSLIEELGCKNILIRVPLWDMENLQKYVAFARSFKNCKILINVLQDREHIDSLSVLKKDLTLLFSSFKGIASQFQIGNAINRSKWGFFSVKEYLEFYQIAFDLRNEKFQEYQLIGPSVIDFEYHFTIRALFGKFAVYFDKVSALLYVDRRGAPENTQMFSFDTTRKVGFLYALATLSARSSNDIVITEANWPISNTKPYAPTSELECVDEEEYARFLLRYYLLCFASQKVQTVYWHQLIASGYGLLDERKGLRKRSAFEVYKVMLAFLQEAQFEKYSCSKDLHVLTCKKQGKKFDVVWLSSKREIELEEFGRVFDMFGRELKQDIKISENPIYAYHK